jgi:hypothetical protein
MGKKVYNSFDFNQFCHAVTWIEPAIALTFTTGKNGRSFLKEAFYLAAKERPLRSRKK